MKFVRLALMAAAAAIGGAAHAGAIGIGGFSLTASLTTFDGLPLAFGFSAPVVIGGNSFTSDTSSLRYSSTFEADCSNECIGNDTDLGYIDVTFGSVQNRVGARVGGGTTTYAGTVDFFGLTNNLLGSVNYGNSAGLVFIGWEELGTGITRMRVRDTASNGRIVHMDDLRFETANAVPLPSTLPLAGLGLLGLFAARRRKA